MRGGVQEESEGAKLGEKKGAGSGGEKQGGNRVEGKARERMGKE